MKRHLRLSQTLFIALLAFAAFGAGKAMAKNSSEPDDELRLDETVLAQEEEFVLFDDQEPVYVIHCQAKIDCKDKKTGADRTGVQPFTQYGPYSPLTACEAQLEAKKKQWETKHLEIEISTFCAPKTFVIIKSACSCDRLRPAD